MNKGGDKIDFTNADDACKKLSKLKEKAKDKNLARSIEEKQKYINKPLSK